MGRARGLSQNTSSILPPSAEGGRLNRCTLVTWDQDGGVLARRRRILFDR